MRTLRWLTVTGLMALLLGVGAAQPTVTLPNGDANGDNVVDDADLLTVLAGLGAPAADLDGNGITDDGDLLVVLSNIGAQGAQAFTGSVQTPSGAFSATLSVSLSSWSGGAQPVKVQLKLVGSEADPDVPIYEFTASVGATPQNVPLMNLPAGVYTVRVLPATAGRWLRTELSEPLVVGGVAGTPAVHVPAPAWAEEVIPTDGIPSGGLGPSSASQVNLASGEYENTPPADIRARNPKGPDVAFVRRYSSYLAKQGYASPGLSLGWVHQYDLRVEGTLGSWGALSLFYPNGARETLTPELQGGVPTGKLTPPAGAPYCAAATPTNQVGRWDQIVIVHRDNSKWIFRPHATGANNRLIYRLVNIVDRAGNSVTLSWDTTGRLLTITRSDGQRLLECEYAGGLLRAVKVYDATGTVATRVLLEYTDGLLTRISQVTDSSTAPPRWSYRYRVIAGIPLLEVVGTPNPAAGAGATTLATHSIGYTPQGVVQLMVDANGHARTYQYSGTTTQVKVYNRESGQVDFQWTQKIGALNVNAGLVDAAQNSSSTTYVNNYLPIAHTNRNGQTSQILYDVYGNVQEVIGPRGNRVVYTYDYPPDYPCSPVRQITVTEYGSDGTAKLPTRYVFYEQTAPVPGVVGGYGVAGLLARVIEPKPGVVGGDPNNPNNFVVTNYHYTQQGSLLEVRAPAPNDTPNAVRTTRYFYGLDPFLGFSDPVGERVNAPVAMGVYEGAHNPNAPYANLLYRESWRYDARGNVARVIRGRRGDNPSSPPVGHFETELEYNAADQLIRVRFPADIDGFQAIHEYVYRYPGGQLVGVVANDPVSSARNVATTRGREGEYRGVPQGAQIASFTRDAQYRVTGVTNGEGQTTNYTYSDTGFLNLLQYPTNFSTPNSRDTYRYEYDPDGNLLKRFDPNAPQTAAIHLVRSPVDSRVEFVDYAGSTSDVTVIYDAFNRVIGLQSSVATISYTYDDGDRLLSTTTQYPGQPAITVSYAYYPDGSRARMNAPYALDLSGNLLLGDYLYRYQHYGSAPVNFVNGPGELVEVATPFGNSPIRTYFSTDGVAYRQETPRFRMQAGLNPRGLIRSLINIAETPTSSVQISNFSDIRYNAAGAIWRLTARLESLNPNVSTPVLYGTVVYEFGRQGRTSLITRETFTRISGNTPSYTWHFPFDAADNPIWQDVFNANNQIAVNSAFQYDANGNATLWDGIAVSYDAANRALGFGANLPHNIRPDGLRAFKQGIQGPRYFIYDGDTVIFEYEPANRTFRAYAYGANGLAMSFGIPPREGRSKYTVYAYDPFGRRVNRIDADDFEDGYLGQAAAWYNAYGGVAFDFSPRSGGSYARDPVGYLGQWGYYTDLETAPVGSLTGKLYVDATYYDPAKGLKLNRSSSGTNPYAGLYLQGDSLAHLCWNTVVATAEAGYLSADPSAPEGLAFLKALQASAGVVQIASAIEGLASLPRVLAGVGLLAGEVAESIATGSFFPASPLNFLRPISRDEVLTTPTPRAVISRLPTKLYHYTSDEVATLIEQSQLGLPGRPLYLTTHGDLTPLQAQLELALLPHKNLATAVFEVNTSALNPILINAVRRVTGNINNRPGGGWEIIYWGTISREYFRRIR